MKNIILIGDDIERIIKYLLENGYINNNSIYTKDNISILLDDKIHNNINKAIVSFCDESDDYIEYLDKHYYGVPFIPIKNFSMDNIMKIINFI